MFAMFTCDNMQSKLHICVYALVCVYETMVNTSILDHQSRK